MKLQGKKILITGGSNGIGRAIAFGMAREGTDILITYRSAQAEAEKAVEEMMSYGVKAYSIQADLNDLQQASQIAQQAIELLGKVDILVNNAGTLTRQAFIDIPFNELEMNMNVNLIAPFMLSQYIAKHMVEQKIQGSILNISSISDRMVHKNLAHYQCSKAGMTMLTKSAAYELAEYGIRVNAISPGLTATNINKDQRDQDQEKWQQRSNIIPIGRTATPEDYVGAAIFLSSDDANYITGEIMIIDGGRLLESG